jgi:hypothetical protein
MRILIVVASLIWFLAPPNYESFAQQVDSEIPFTFEKGHIIVAAKVKDKEPVEMAIATGLERSIVGAGNIHKYNLRLTFIPDAIPPGRSDPSAELAEVQGIRLGDADGRRLLMHYTGNTVNTISKDIGREIFAVLGADFFKGRTVQFDFKKKLIRFLSNWKAPKEGSESVAILPMLVDSMRPIRRPIVERVSFNGKPIKALLDTGSVTIISFTPTGAKELGLSVPAPKSNPQPAKVSLALEKISFPEVPGVVYPKDSSFDKDSSGYSAMLGIAVLQNFIITFDFEDAVVVLERNF